MIGTAGLVLRPGLTVVGLVAERREPAAARALLFFLPVFGHFAANVFFLAGLAVVVVYAVILIGAAVPSTVFDWPPRTGWWGFPSNVWSLAR